MLDIIEFKDYGCKNYLHGVLFLSKNKYNILNAVHLPKQNIYLVCIMGKYSPQSRSYYRLVPIEDCTCKKYCKLLKYEKQGYSLRCRGVHLYSILEDECIDLINKEKKLNKQNITGGAKPS